MKVADNCLLKKSQQKIPAGFKLETKLSIKIVWRPYLFQRLHPLVNEILE